MHFRYNLHSIASRGKKRAAIPETPSDNLSSHINYRFLSTPEKVARLHCLRRKNRALSLRIKRLNSKVAAAIETDGVILDGQTSTDIQTIMEDENKLVCSKYPKNSFPFVFWKQQMECSLKQGKLKNRIRWHPLMVKWCIYLRHQSSKAYETLRDSGIALPSQRTLRDYSNAVKAAPGFSLEVDQQILQAAKLASSPDYHRLVVLLIDELHIKEELIYDKHSGQLIGFVNLGKINNHLARFEQSLFDDDHPTVNNPPLAKSMLAFMVRGLFTKLKFVYAQFPCISLTGEQLFCPFWEAVFRLERIGFNGKYEMHQIAEKNT